MYADMWNGSERQLQIINSQMAVLDELRGRGIGLLFFSQNPKPCSAVAQKA